MSPQRSPRQSLQETRVRVSSTEFNLESPQQERSKIKLQSPRLSFSSSPRTQNNNEHAQPPQPPQPHPPRPAERRSSFKAAIKTLVSPVKKASAMLGDSFRSLNSPQVYEEEEGDDEDGEEAAPFKQENTDLTLILLCRELELLSD